MVILTQSNFDEKISSVSYDSQISISKEVSLDAEKIAQILELCPEAQITILSGYDKSQVYSKLDSLYNEAETSVLVANVNTIQQKTGKTVTFDKQFTVEQALNASRQINEIVETIQSARVNGRELSPYEKYMYALMFVTSREYKDVEANASGERDKTITDNIISILNGDKITCVGFAGMLAVICSRLGIPCTNVAVSVEEKKEDGSISCSNHLANIVRMVDPRYGLDGLYYSDATPALTDDGELAFSRTLLPIDEASKLYPGKVHLQKASEIEIRGHETKYNLLDRPVIMAPLFPEISKGKNQKEIILKEAKKKVEETHVEGFIANAIDSLTEEEMIESLKNKYRRLLKPRYLSLNLKDEKNFRIFTLNTIHDMIQDGFSKEEAISFVKELYSAERFIAEEEPLRRSFKSDALSTQEKKKLDDEVKTLNFYRERLDLIAGQFNFEKPASLSSITDVLDNANWRRELTEILQEIAKPEISKHCLGVELKRTGYYYDDPTTHDRYPMEALGKLVKLGVPRDEIVDFLKQMLSSYNLAKEYAVLADQSSLLIDENEVYINGGERVSIYNKPYEKAFEKEAKKAKGVVKTQMAVALSRIYMSQGMNQEDAVQRAIDALDATVDLQSLAITKYFESLQQ